MKKLKLTELEKQSKHDVLSTNEMHKIVGATEQCCCENGMQFRRVSRAPSPQPV